MAGRIETLLLKLLVGNQFLWQLPHIQLFMEAQPPYLQSAFRGEVLLEKATDSQRKGQNTVLMSSLEAAEGGEGRPAQSLGRVLSFCIKCSLIYSLLPSYNNHVLSPYHVMVIFPGIRMCCETITQRSFSWEFI